MVLKKIVSSFDATDKSGIRNMILKPIGMGLSLLYTPLLLSYLGDTKYGLWTTILSIVSWVNYCDVGIGHGLRNLLTKELTDKQYENARKSVSTAYILLSAISVVLLIVLLIAGFFLDWKEVFNTTEEIRGPFLVSFIFIIINFVLALCNTMLYALQLSERVALRSCLAQILNIVGVFLLKQFTEGNLMCMAILFGCTTMVIHLGNTLQLMKKHPYLRPAIRCFDKSRISAIGNVGIRFFVIQISCLLLYTVDNFLITHYFGAAEVTPFHITYSVFNMAHSFLSALLVPYWSRTTQMLQKGDIGWIKQAVKKMRLISGVFIVGYILLAVLFKPLVRIWVGRDLAFQPGLIEVMCVYYILFTIVTTHTPFINGSGKINGQLVVSTFMGIANVPLSIFLGVNCQMGVVGIRLATTILMAIGAVFYPLNWQRILKDFEKKISAKIADSENKE